MKEWLEFDAAQMQERVRLEFPWADDVQVGAMVASRLAWAERQRRKRPLTIHEVAARWYCYDKVVNAIASRRLRPRPDGKFEWPHVLAVDIGIAAMMGRPHPDDAKHKAPSRWEEINFDAVRLHDRAVKLVESFTSPERAPAQGETHIYFIKPRGHSVCKIGKADDLRSRFHALQLMSGPTLQLLAFKHGPPSLERDLHRKFADERQHGEWFEITERLRRFINKTRREFGLPEWAVAVE